MRVNAFIILFCLLVAVLFMDVSLSLREGLNSSFSEVERDWECVGVDEDLRVRSCGADLRGCQGGGDLLIITRARRCVEGENISGCRRGLRTLLYSEVDIDTKCVFLSPSNAMPVDIIPQIFSTDSSHDKKFSPFPFTAPAPPLFNTISTTDVDGVVVVRDSVPKISRNLDRLTP